MMTTCTMDIETLIDTASKRVLKHSEKVAMARHFMLKKHGSVAKARAAVNRAYALAKKYDAFGGGDTYDRLMEAFFETGAATEEFRVLYDASK